MRDTFVGYMSLENFVGEKMPKNMVVLRDYPGETIDIDPKLRRVRITLQPQTLAETTWEKLTEAQKWALRSARVFSPDDLEARVRDGTLQVFFDGLGTSLEELLAWHRVKQPDRMGVNK